MKKLFTLIAFCLIVSLAQAQTAKPKIFEGSLMIFTDTKSKIGLGGVSPAFFKVNLAKKLSVGTALAPIIWYDFNKKTHTFGQAGFVIRADYKKISIGCNILTIAGVDTRFVGIGVKL